MEWFRSLVARVDAAFEVTGRAHDPWPDPHPDRSPDDDEYSRVTDPGKWRIIGARADAWIEALTAAGLADVHRDGAPSWHGPVPTEVHRVDLLVPRREGALPLVLARSRLGGAPDAGVTIGVGRPAVAVHAIPDCGCDGCDSGSQDVLDELDEWVGGIVRGELRRLERHVERPPAPEGFRWGVPTAEDRVLAAPDRDATWALPAQEVISVIADGSWSASGSFARGEVEAALANPSGWSELRGFAWSDG